MAYQRSLLTKAILTARAYSPSFSYGLRDYDHKEDSPGRALPQRKVCNFIQRRTFGSGFNYLFGSGPSGGFFHGKRIVQFSLGSSAGSAFVQYMSSTVGEGLAKFELVSDVADVLSDVTMQVVANHALAVNEVAIAAADSFFPVAALQHFIDVVHDVTGFNWWASIIVTTLLIRSATLPLLINQLKATSKLTLFMLHAEKIVQELQDKGMGLAAVADGQERLLKLREEYYVSPFALLKGPFIQGPLYACFFLATLNMAEKVPSFKSGGAFWFTDLTTPDSFYVLPILTGLSLMMLIECNMLEGLEGDPAPGLRKLISRYLVVLSVQLSMILPKIGECEIFYQPVVMKILKGFTSSFNLSLACLMITLNKGCIVLLDHIKPVFSYV